MTRASLALALLAAAASGCGGSKSTVARVNFRQPSAIAIFRGYTVHDPSRLLPYLAVANASRNDLTLVELFSDKVVDAPLPLRPLAIPFPDRPALLASADLGDGKADLLVGVSAGSSVLQLVDTWTPANAVDGDPVKGQAVDVGGDVVALAALPPLGPPAVTVPTVRIVVALAGGRLARVEYTRDGDAIKKSPVVVVQELAFEPLSLATILPTATDPGVPDRVWAATLDAVAPGVFGVAEIDVSGPGPWPVSAIDARAPTRLVAAARLQERRPGATEPNEAAFAGQPVVTRVYAVLDEGSCGPRRRIDCGLVALDPEKLPAPGIPQDDGSVEGGAWMPYRAPVPFITRPLAIAVATPPSVPDATYPAGTMRLQLAADRGNATTAVAIVAAEDGQVHFVDLGRFRLPTTTPLLTSAKAVTELPDFVKNTIDQSEARLWIRDSAKGSPPGDFAPDAAGAVAAVGVTPGYTPDASWSVTYQPVLPGLELRMAEAGQEAGTPTKLWVAIQVGEGPAGAHATTQVAKVYHPALGVAVGDIAVINVRDARGNAICTPGGSTTATVFELEISELLPPAADHPGGAVVLKAPAAGAECYTALLGMTSPTALSPPIIATIRAGGLAEADEPARIARGLVVVRNNLEYAGRLTPTLVGDPPDPPVVAPNSYDYVLQYPAGLDDGAAFNACPLALVDWDGSFPPVPALPACDATCRADCETLVLARLARRVHHLAEGCADQACLDRFADKVFPAVPFVNGPALMLRVGVQPKPGTAPPPTLAPTRAHKVSVITASGANPLVDRPEGATVQANGALPFDRSVWVPEDRYRFFVSYPGNQVVDVSPWQSPVSRTVIR